MRFIPRSSLARNTGWMFLGQGLGYVLRLVYFILIARLLGVLQYGVVVGAFALVNLMGPYSRLGTGTLLMRYVSADHSRFALFWGNVLLVTLSMSGFLILILHFLGPHVLSPASAAVVVLTAVSSCLFEQLVVSSTQVFQAFQEMRTAAIFNQLTSMLRTCAAVIMFVTLHHASAWQWCMAAVVSTAIGTVIAITTVTIRFGRPKLAPHLAWQYGTEGVEYAFSASTTSAYDDLDKAMLSHYGMNAANGIYTMAYRIIELATVPIASIQLAAEPRLFQLAASGVESAMVLGRRLLIRGLLVSIGVAACMYMFAPLIPLLVGKGFTEGVLALRWLCIIPVFRSIHGITGSVLTCTGMQRRRTLTQIAAVILNFTLNLWLIPAHGWRGAAWASLATDGALALMNWTALQRARHTPAPIVAAASPVVID